MAPYQPELLSSQKDEITNASTIIRTAGAPAPAPAPPAPVLAPAPAPAPVAAAPAAPPPIPAPKPSKSRSSSKKMSKTAGTVKQTAAAAENALAQEKEQQDDIAFISQLEALRQATHYAADLMGLPPDCPDACVQICLPGFCAPHCCAKSIIPQNFMNMYNNKNTNNNNNNNYNYNNAQAAITNPSSTSVSTTRQNTPLTAPTLTAPAAQRYNAPGYPLRTMSSVEIINAQRKHLLAMQHKAQRRAALRKMAYLRRMRGQALAPIQARYNKMALYNRRKALMRKSAQARAAQQYASAYCKYSRRCAVPNTRNFAPAAAPAAANPVRTCSSICRLTCIPQCPNECCSRVKKKTVVPHGEKKHPSHAH